MCKNIYLSQLYLFFNCAILCFSLLGCFPVDCDAELFFFTYLVASFAFFDFLSLEKIGFLLIFPLKNIKNCKNLHFIR